MSKWLKKYHDGVNQIESVIDYLEYMSELLYKVGNERLSTKLNRQHNFLCDGLALIKASHDENFDEQVKRTQESSANVLKACLVGVELGKSEADLDEIGKL